MNNSFFIRSKEVQDVRIVRFHICTWEFRNDTSFVEFGMELDSVSIKDLKYLELELYIPWIKFNSAVTDFYTKLKDSENSRFIFNDSVSSTKSLDGGKNIKGVIHEFIEREKLCLLPVRTILKPNQKKVQIRIDLSDYKSNCDCNVYVRIGVDSKNDTIAVKKNGLGESTIIYDIKVNETRNAERFLIEDFKQNNHCRIDQCFCFHIIPNNYNITFFESEHLRNVRALEFEPFKTYLGESRLKKDELIVVFSKKSEKESYSFFSIYSKERIGAIQFAMAILVNIICGFLFVFPSIRKNFSQDLSLSQNIKAIPPEYYIATSLVVILLGFLFIRPLIVSLHNKLK